MSSKNAELVIIATGAGMISGAPARYCQAPAPYYRPASYGFLIGTLPARLVKRCLLDFCLRAPTVRRLDNLDRYLPTYLRADASLFFERCRLLQRLQQPFFVLEQVTEQQPLIAEWLALAYGAEGDSSVPSECAARHFRRLRADLAEVVFNLDDFTLRYLHRLLPKPSR